MLKQARINIEVNWIKSKYRQFELFTKNKTKTTITVSVIFQPKWIQTLVCCEHLFPGRLQANQGCFDIYHYFKDHNHPFFLSFPLSISLFLLSLISCCLHISETTVTFKNEATTKNPTNKSILPSIVVHWKMHKEKKGEINHSFMKCYNCPLFSLWYASI